MVIFSSNEEVPGMLHSRHVRHRKFTRDVEEWFPEWQLLKTFKNNQSKNKSKINEPSIDFFIFQTC